MAYQAIYRDWKTKEYYLRDEHKGWETFKHSPTYYQIHPEGQFPTLDGKRANPTQQYSDEVYERDLDPKTRVLIDRYLHSDDVPKWQNIVYFDIEIEILGALTPENIKEARAQITSIALFDDTTKITYCWIVDKEQKLSYFDKNNRFIIPCKSEKELLNLFLDKWEECDPTIITGWNSGFFDVPYLYYRICNVLGKENGLRLSPIKKISINERNPDQPVEIGGVNHLDYMRLFKKFAQKQEPSYKLGDIGEKYVKLGKIEYEGNLDQLFRDDPDKFIEYNIRDVDIIIELEKKQKYIELTLIICHLCHVPYEQIYLSTVLNDGAILTYLKRKDIVSPNKPTTINPKIKEVEVGDIVKVGKSPSGTLVEIDDKTGYIKFKSGSIKGFPIQQIRRVEDYAGGYLKDPIPGLYEWVIDLDYTSLYPSIIRSLNIGLETLLGKIVNTNKYDSDWTLVDLKKKDPNESIIIQKLNEDREIIESTTTVGKILKIILDNNLIIAANGSLFYPKETKPSIVADVLEDWFNKRSEFKDKMKHAYKILKDSDQGEFFNKRQHAFKIKLNDVYGSYAINGWRYTDGHKFISSAITLSGQRLDKEAIIFANIWLNEKLETKDIDYVVTADTDSLFLCVKELLVKRNINLKNKEESVEEVLKIASELEKEINEHLHKIASDYFNIKTEHYFTLKQEVVLERGYFSGKRRYAQYIINKEGIPVEELDIKGLDLMKSNMVPLYKKFGENLLTDILLGKPKSKIDKDIVDLKVKTKTLTYKEISRPTGIKKIKEYIKSKPTSGEIFSKLETRCPINTKAAIYYNDLLRFNKLDIDYSCFTEGDKMYYVPLKKNPYHIDVIGFRGDHYDPPFIQNLLDNFMDRESAFNDVLLNKLTTIYEDIKWEFPQLNSKINKFFKF